MPAHILLAALLATPPVVTLPSKEPAVYATIKVGKKDRAWAMAFSPDGKTLAYNVSVGEKVVFWDVAKKEVANTLTAEGEQYPYSFRSLAWEADGKGFIVDRHSSVCRVDARTGKVEKLYRHREPDDSGFEVYCVHHLLERKLIASGGSDGLVRFWDTEKGKELKAVRCAPDKDNYPLAVAVVPNANKVIVAAELATVTKEIGGGGVVHCESSMFAIDMKDFSVSTILKNSPVDQFMNIGVTSGGGEFAYGKEDRVVFTDATTFKTRTTAKCPIEPCQLRFTPNGRYLIAAGPIPIPPVLTLIAKPGGIAVYDLAAEKWIAYWQFRGDGSSWTVSYSESNNLLAWASRDSIITVWDMKGIVDPTAKPKKKD